MNILWKDQSVTGPVTLFCYAVAEAVTGLVRFFVFSGVKERPWETLGETVTTAGRGPGYAITEPSDPVTVSGYAGTCPCYAAKKVYK